MYEAWMLFMTDAEFFVSMILMAAFLFMIGFCLYKAQAQ